ncbi:IclR family transcriptional regulator [Chloroflexota bacterium]
MLEIQAVKRALKVLELFSVNRSELGVTEVSQELLVNKAAVARLMFTLKENGFLTGTEEEGRYRLGWKVAVMGSVFLSSVRLREIALPYMKTLRNDLNETVDMCVLNGNSRVCVERLESTYDVRPTGTVGKQLPLHAGAMGKLLLAYMPEDKQYDYFNDIKEHQVFTPNTITSEEGLLEEIAKIKEMGYAISRQERVALVNAVAAPLRNHSGDVVAALGISGLVNSFDEEKMKATMIPRVIEIAAKISRELGFGGTPEKQ